MPQELPKISTLTKALIAPEAAFEKVVKDAAKVEIPKGPQSMLLKLQESLEGGGSPNPNNLLPKLELPKLPTLPAGLPPLPGVEGGEKGPTTTEEIKGAVKRRKILA